MGTEPHVQELVALFNEYGDVAKRYAKEELLYMGFNNLRGAPAAAQRLLVHRVRRRIAGKCSAPPAAEVNEFADLEEAYYPQCAPQDELLLLLED